MICLAVRFFVNSIYFHPSFFFLNLYPKCSLEENIINTNTGHNQPAFLKAAYYLKTIDIAMPYFMRISGNVFIGVNVTTLDGFQNNGQKRQYSIVLFCCTIFCCSFDFLQNSMSFSLYTSFGIWNKCSSKRCHFYKSSNKTADTIEHQCM